MPKFLGGLFGRKNKGSSVEFLALPTQLGKDIGEEVRKTIADSETNQLTDGDKYLEIRELSFLMSFLLEYLSYKILGDNRYNHALNTAYQEVLGVYPDDYEAYKERNRVYTELINTPVPHEGLPRSYWVAKEFCENVGDSHNPVTTLNITNLIVGVMKENENLLLHYKPKFDQELSMFE
ncbi:hypothetical protein [Paenibacillus sp. Y412MC10]|uniref:hypothetical protein n=1 Tax=Geobacillus sp. (strain Y412MC10) TaxID=481743 RepID=UPI0011A4C021|nr:hypothetical protein [Paenibacillus sp. Y412MC10]